MITIPGFVRGFNDDVEQLMYRFGNCRRRAYIMKQRGVDRPTILKQLHQETELPTRYVYAAYDTIKTLLPHVAFGGLQLQRLREAGRITRKEYHARRNAILACRGDRSRKGNVCLRIENGMLRINIEDKRWVKLPIQIPNKYLSTLSRAEFYTVQVKRRLDMKGYDVKITIPVEPPPTIEARRVMALDINSGHVDFAVAEKSDLRPVAFGKVDCHELLDAKKDEKQALLHRLVNKVARIAKHYQAEVVVGKLRSNYMNHCHHFNRRVQGMNQFELRRILRYKLPLKGVGVSERSEAYTSKVGAELSQPLGLDVHKASAYAFAVKVIDYASFTFLRDAHADEGNGSLSIGLNGRSELTVPHQSWLSGLMCSDPYSSGEATPNLGKGGWSPRPAETSILQVKV